MRWARGFPNRRPRDGDLVLHELAVGDDDGIAVAGFDGGLPPADFADDVFDIIHANPIIDSNAALHAADRD